MRIFYRISDKSYEKPGLKPVSKQACLANFLGVFNVRDVVVLADNCSEDTVKMVKDHGVKVVVPTALGNAGSFLKSLEMSLDSPPNEIIYFVEDDYLHLPDAPAVLEEGLDDDIGADYVTLYDHPDKYSEMYACGETCKVMRGKKSHWRTTISTCMTFGSTAQRLKRDQKVFQKYCAGNHPFDHQIFCELKGKSTLAVCIPGRACHMDLTLSAQLKENLIEPWAQEMKFVG